MVKIEAEPQVDEVEPVELVGADYEFRFPKIAPVLAGLSKANQIKDKNEQGQMILDVKDRWLAEGFGPEQWADIQHRLNEEPSDPLDFKHIILLFEALFKAAAGGVPPTLLGDSSRVSPTIGQRAVEPSRLVSTPGLSQSAVSSI